MCSLGSAADATTALVAAARRSDPGFAFTVVRVGRASWTGCFTTRSLAVRAVTLTPGRISAV